MDFHALPRRDLQALCKRNGIRANMTSAAMADALAALPAVDGVEEYAKPPVAEPTPAAKAAVPAVRSEEEKEGEGEMQGISLPGGRGVARTPPEVIILSDGEEEDKDLTPAALGVGRRRSSRRPRVEPVAVPATRKRDAASMAETAAEAVPPRTTRARSQRAVVSAPEEEAPEARRGPRRAVARKTGTEQEEEDKGTQVDVSEDCAVDSSVQERQADVQQISSKEIHHASEDTETVPVDEEPQPMLASSEAAEEVDFTSGAAEENEVPTSGISAKAIEEKEPVAAPARITRRRAAASMAEIAVEAVLARTTRAQSQMVVVSAPEEKAPKARRASRRAVAAKTGQEHKEKGTQGDASDGCVVDSSVQERQVDVRNDTVSGEEIHHASAGTKMLPVISGEAAEEVDFTSVAAEENVVPTSPGLLQTTGKAIEEEEPVAAPARTTRKRAAASMADIATKAVVARTTRARSQRVVVSAPEEEVPKARRTSRRAAARKTEQEEEEKGTQGDVSDECMVDSSVQELQGNVQQCVDSPIIQNDTVSSEEICHANTKMVPAKEVPLATLISSEAAEEVDFAPGSIEENEVPTFGGMLQSAAKAIDEKEDMATNEVTNNTNVSVLEEVVVATDEMPLSLATMDESAKEEMVSIDNLSQATVTDHEGVVKESGFTADLTDVSIEEEAPMPDDGMPQSLATLDEDKEEVIPVDYLSQATVTDDEGAVKETGFSCDLTEVSVEEKIVVATDSMPQSLETLDKGVEQVVTIENLSQATLTDDEGTVKESGSGQEDGVVAADEMSQRSTLDESVKEEVATIENLSQATITDDEWVGKESAFAGDFSDHTATKFMSIDSITVEPMVSEAAEVPLRMYGCGNSGGQKNVTEPVAVEREKEVKKDKECETLGSLSLRKLRIKLKEKVAVEREKEGDCKALGSLSLRKLKEKVAVAQENEAGEKTASEPVAVKQEEEMKGGNKSEALGSLSLRKLRTKLKEKVAVAQEKEGKAIDKLSLRQLKMKLKETLNAQKVIGKSHQSMY